MISPSMVKLITCLPKGLVSFVSRKVLMGYIKKYANIRINGLENLDGCKKPILFICNHLSNSDALVIDNILKNQDITFVAGVKLNSTPLTSLGMSITKTIGIKPNTADKEAISNIIKTLKKGNNILIFPEGTRSRTTSMIEAKKGVVLIQRLSKATVVPLGLVGTEKFLPINDSDMGSEEFQYADITLNIGNPIDNVPKKEKDEDKHDYEERITKFFMESIAALLPESYQGVYKIKK